MVRYAAGAMALFIGSTGAAMAVSVVPGPEAGAGLLAMGVLGAVMAGIKKRRRG